VLEFHFLNVGHGDCTIIRHPSGRLTMVDINNGQLLDADTLAEEAATVPYAHLGAPSTQQGKRAVSQASLLTRRTRYSARRRQVACSAWVRHCRRPMRS
jgi:hypothetical protein